MNQFHVSDQFHAFRSSLMAALADLSPLALQALAADLRMTAAQIEAALRERHQERETERRDARLYRQRGEP